jgi:hypothetical protein
MTMPSKAIRKTLLVASALAMPMSVIIATGVTAGAAEHQPDPPVTCSVSGTFQFGGSGISKDGGVGFPVLNFIETGAFGGCSGSGTPNDVIYGVRCDKHVPGLPASNPACQPKNYGFNSWANVTDGTLASWIQKDSRGQQGWRMLINGKDYYANATNAVTIPAGGACGSSEMGFHMVATVRGPRVDRFQILTLTYCLGAITGTGLNPGDNFYDASVDQIGHVSSAAIDPATSTVHIS